MVVVLDGAIVLTFVVVIALLLIIAIPRVCLAQTPRIDRIEIRTVGVYEATTGPKTEENGSVAGYKNKVLSYKFVSFGTTIPMRRGTRFGFEYILVGTPVNATVSLRQVIIFPSPGLRNPEKAQTWERDDFIMGSEIGSIRRIGYAIEKDWEMVPGTWTFQLWDGNRKLAEQSFTLTTP